MTRGRGQGRLLAMLSLACLTLTCGGGDGGACGAPDGGLSCVDVCGDIDEFRRFPCDKPPYMLCDAHQEATRPLNKAQLDYVVEKCRQCSGCNKGCQACSAGLPPL